MLPEAPPYSSSQACWLPLSSQSWFLPVPLEGPPTLFFLLCENGMLAAVPPTPKTMPSAEKCSLNNSTPQSPNKPWVPLVGVGWGANYEAALGTCQGALAFRGRKEAQECALCVKYICHFCWVQQGPLHTPQIHVLWELQMPLNLETGFLEK